MSHTDRVSRLQMMMDKCDYDVLLLTDAGSQAYVSGIFSFAWHGGDAVIVPKRGDVFRVLSIAEQGRHEIDGWIENLVYWSPPFSGCKPKPFIKTLGEVVSDLAEQPCRVGVEMTSMPAAWMEGIRKQLPGYSFSNVTKEVKHVMMIKDEEEVQWMRKLAAFSEIGFEAALEEIQPGAKETDIAAAGDAAMFRAGASYVYTPSLAISDTRVVWDHPPTERKLDKGDVVKVDFHPVYNEYRGDYFNTISLGEPKRSFRKMCDAVSEATRDMLSAMKPGAVGRDLDRVFRKKLVAKGFGGLSNVYLGHGIGTTHLPPFISETDDTVLSENIVVVINPFCYKPMEEGIFMEYMTLITNTGVEVLNKGPLNLIIRNT